ncbi:hypothetical protein BV25DRAFT_1769605, partial [Artomyces pyxidatus]
CNRPTLWDGKTPSRCKRSGTNNRILDRDGLEICLDWQRASGCVSRKHAERHRCSGCGSTNHGAARCHLAE